MESKVIVSEKQDDKVCEEGIKANLNEGLPFSFKIYDTVESTNILMKEYTFCHEGYTIVASNQEGGIGRNGKTFYSPQNTGVYFSILLKPQFSPTETIYITTMAAVAICNALAKVTNTNPKIKWVNDIYIKDKKVCGILATANFKAKKDIVEYVILGIGINVYPPDGGFPQDIENIAGAVLDKTVRGLKNQLVAEVCTEFWKLYTEKNFKKIAEEYKEKSFLIGKNIVIHQNGQKKEAVVLDIDENCFLEVKHMDGKVEKISSGEISISMPKL